MTELIQIIAPWFAAISEFIIIVFWLSDIKSRIKLIERLQTEFDKHKDDYSKRIEEADKIHHSLEMQIQEVSLRLENLK